MASTPSGTVQQYNLSGSEYLYTDTGSYGTVSSRVLTVYDYLGNVVNTYNMGSAVTQIVTLSSDGWYQFVCVVADNVSGSPWTATVYWLAGGYFIAAYLNQYSLNGCYNNTQTTNTNLTIANNAYLAALRSNLGATGYNSSEAIAAQNCIIAANYFVNLSPVVQYQ